MAAVLGLIIGVVIGVFVRPDIPIALQPYLPIMVLAALDARIAEEIGEGVVKQIIVKGPEKPSWRHGRYSVPGRGPRDTYG